jgi:ParB family chromosome partitioning protein
MQNLAKQIADKKLSVRDTERLVQQSRSQGKKDAGKTAPKQSPQVKSLVEELQRRLGTKVRLTERSPGKGTIEVDFFSYDDLDRLLKLLRKE